MNQSDTKEALCRKHEALLSIILTYGAGAMLLPQLRALCLALGLYPNAQAVNRAVRELKDADILTRQTWIDNNSDLLLARKYAIRYFGGLTSQEAATPRRPTTMAPYILTARKIDWLLTYTGKKGLGSLDALEAALLRDGNTLFLHRPELADYYRRHADTLSQENPQRFREQLERLESSPAFSTAPQMGEPVATWETSHRRGLYITALVPQQRAAALALFPSRETTAERAADWAIDAYSCLASLLPYWKALLTLYVLDDNHAQALREALAARESGSSTNYWHRCLEASHIEGLLHLRIESADFSRRWCGGIQKIY